MIVVVAGVAEAVPTRTDGWRDGWIYGRAWPRWVWGPSRMPYWEERLNVVGWTWMDGWMDAWILESSWDHVGASLAILSDCEALLDYFWGRLC